MPLKTEEVSHLQKRPKFIRNVCILAHVDHGKTTLADNIISSNGLMSRQMCGTQLYLDTRKDEMKRGITMKCSSIAIYHSYKSEYHLINLIDSPGHVDFSGEVSTAVRLCDGAIVIVDVIEGVCAQTKVTLTQAWREHIQPVLVFNKIDKLILEKKLTTYEAYIHLRKILEQVNATTAELFTSREFGKVEETSSVEGASTTIQCGDLNDSEVYFSPEKGNVVFASAIDGWGFRIQDFASIYSKKLGMKEEILLKTLWGNYYYDKNTKRVKVVKDGDISNKKRSPLFVTFILEEIWKIYETIVERKDIEAFMKLAQSLSIKLTKSESKISVDAKNPLQALFHKWLPLSTSILNVVCEMIPSPIDLSSERVESLMCTALHGFDSLPTETQALKQHFQACSSAESSPTIVCISKMFPYEKKNLPQNRARLQTMEEIQNWAKQKLLQKEKEENGLTEDTTPANENVQKNAEDDGPMFVAFARVFSGVLKKGQQVYVLGPKYDPSKYLTEDPIDIDANLTLDNLPPDCHVTVATLNDFYFLMGGFIENLDEVPAGNIVGIGGLEKHVLKSATLSTDLACPPFTDLHGTSVPFLRVALEPKNPLELNKLKNGLKLLNQADPCVQVLIQETGELILITAGDIHLQKCLEDLKENFAKIEINVSSPIVPFRETIILPPKIDRVNETIEDSNRRITKVNENEVATNDFTTPNKQMTIRIKAVPLPENVSKLLLENYNMLKAYSKATYKQNSGNKIQELSQKTKDLIKQFRQSLDKEFKAEGGIWENAIDKIWGFGPHRCGPNILLNNIPNYKASVWNVHEKDMNMPHISTYEICFINGFQLATSAGPMCDEPMMGVCFIIEDCILNNQQNKELDITEEISNLSISSNNASYLSGQIITTIKEGCRKAFQTQPQRLLAAMYSCDIQVREEMLGRMYGVLGSHQGKVVYSDQNEGTNTFTVKAILPIIESFTFGSDLLKKTSGMALPQLIFSHWEIIENDPFWVPNTEEEYIHFGEKADSGNIALDYMNMIRRRKGLAVNEKIVEHGEKQRTLTRNK